MRITVAAALQAVAMFIVYTRRNAIKNDLSSHPLVIRSVYHPIHHGRQQLKHGGRAGHGYDEADMIAARRRKRGRVSAQLLLTSSPPRKLFIDHRLSTGTLFSFDHQRDASDQLSSENSLFTEARSFEQSIEASARPSINVYATRTV